MKKRFIKLGIPHSKIRVLYNAVDTDYFTPKDAVTDETRCHSTPKRRVIALYVGNLDLAKGIDVLLKAIPSIVEHQKNFILLVVGSGSRRDELEETIREHHLEDHVRFLGFRKDVRPYYQMADVLVLPSLREGMSNVLIEAMSSSLPVVATNVGCTPEVIQSNRNGVTVTAGNSEELATTIINLLNNCSRIRTLSRNARITVRSKYDIGVIGERYESILYSLTDR